MSEEINTETLRLSALSIGIKYSENIEFWDHDSRCSYEQFSPNCSCGAQWNPLYFDDQLLKLICKLHINLQVESFEVCAEIWREPNVAFVKVEQPVENGCVQSALARAVVKTAARWAEKMHKIGGNDE